MEAFVPAQDLAIDNIDTCLYYLALVYIVDYTSS